ncbi:MAG: ATP-binding protein [Lachnospiraceae bacterium]|nr:ATP-binding protein [Lachnospiraceae bacterium]
MALTQTQYEGLMRVYEERRDSARHTLEENRRTIRETIPGYRDIENRIADLAVKCSLSVLDGDDRTASKISDEIKELSSEQKKLLSESGFEEDFLEEKYVCRDCSDTGYLPSGEKCHCLKRAITRFMYRQSNIEEVLEKENFDTLRYDIYTDTEREKIQPIIDECRHFADDFGSVYRNILLYGNVGTGKTFLTNCIAKAVLDKGYSVIYFTSMRLFDTLSRVQFSYDYEGFRDVQDDIFSCDLLIIDDLGTENVNSFVASRLFDIINERDLRKKSTVISTNLNFGELDARYTDRSFSRLFGSYTVLHPDVEDIRVRKRRSGL